MEPHYLLIAIHNLSQFNAVYVIHYSCDLLLMCFDFLACMLEYSI